MIAEKFGQDPRAVAEWEPEWIAAASTMIEAEAGAAREHARAAARKAKLAKMRRGA